MKKENELKEKLRHGKNRIATIHLTRRLTGSEMGDQRLRLDAHFCQSAHDLDVVTRMLATIDANGHQ